VDIQASEAFAPTTGEGGQRQFVKLKKPGCSIINTKSENPWKLVHWPVPQGICGSGTTASICTEINSANG